MLKIGLVSPFLPEKDGIAIYSDNLIKGTKNIVKIGRTVGADYLIDFKSSKLKEQLEKIIMKEKLSVIHIQYVASFFNKFFNLNLIRALNLSVPVIVTLHEVHYRKRNFKDHVLGIIEKLIVRNAAMVIVHTPKQAKFLERNYSVKNVKVIYHGLRLNKFPSRKKGKNILCFGMLSTNKGVQYLISAMKYLNDFKLTIAGRFVDLQSKELILGALKQSKAEIKTDFEWIEEKTKEGYYKKADIVVLPHVWAPYQSGILHNSIAWGLPVVVTRVGALYEMAELFGLGEVVEPKSPKALGEAIKKVHKNHQIYQKGIKNYREKANWGQITKEHLELYNEIH